MDIIKKPHFGGVQPKHHAPKSSIQSHIRRQKLIKGLIEGKAISDIALTLGLSPKTASCQANAMLLEPKTQLSFARILAEGGLTDRYLAAKVKSLIEAKTTVFAQKDGVFTDEREIDALETQRKTLDLACRLVGHLKPEMQSGIINNNGLMQVIISQLSKDDQGR